MLKSSSIKLKNHKIGRAKANVNATMSKNIHSHLDINPQDTSIHTRRASSVVSRTTSKSSIETNFFLTEKQPTNTTDSGLEKVVPASKQNLKHQNDEKKSDPTSLHNSVSSMYTINNISKPNINQSESHFDLVILGKKLELSSREQRPMEGLDHSTEDDEEEEEEQEGKNDEWEGTENISEQEDEEEQQEEEEEAEEYEELKENEEEEEKCSKLIERYLAMHQEYRMQIKKNDYLQDKLYHSCLRKEIIVLKQDILEGTRKNKVINESQNVKQTNNDDAPYAIVNETEEDDDKKNKEMDHNCNNSKILMKISLQGAPNQSAGMEGFRMQILSTKYHKIIGQVADTMRSKLSIAEIHLTEMLRKKRESEEMYDIVFREFMNRIEIHSSEAINANTGRHLSRRDTVQYITEMNKLFEKLRKTTKDFYKNWHGLNYELKSLEETETQRGEGLHVLEYEQLCGENESLRDKAEYREQELVKARHKISHCVQILAHFKETEKHMDTTITRSSTNLNKLNNKIKQLTEIVDIMYSILTDEEKVPHRESELFENVKLMKDFETANNRKIQLQKIRQDISQQVHHHEFDIKVLEDQIQTIKNNGSYFRKIAEREKLKAADAAAKKLKHEVQRKEEKRQKMEKLLILLERRTTEPWKNILDTEIMTPKINLMYNNHGMNNYNTNN